jgi:hypothetical protein
MTWITAISQIARLYRPLETDAISDADESDDEGTSGTQLLPLYTSHPPALSKSKPTKVNLGDVWDEREQLFGVGDDSDDDEGTHTPRQQRDTTPLPPPKIVVTSSWTYQGFLWHHVHHHLALS